MKSSKAIFNCACSGSKGNGKPCCENCTCGDNCPGEGCTCGCNCGK